jgi:hypothetical protein
MTPCRAPRFDEAMEAPAVDRRVIIAVQPRLLADTLARALGLDDVDVVIGLEPATPGEADFDLAVVMGDLPPGVHADIVIQLPSDEGSAAGSVTTSEGTQPALFADLAAVLETLNHYLRPV